MELKKFTIFIILMIFSNQAYAELIKPNKKLDSFEVVKIQLEAL